MLLIFSRHSVLKLDYLRVEIAAAARQRPMKLYLYTANGLQRSRCSEIDSPEEEKMPINRNRLILKEYPPGFSAISGKLPDIAGIVMSLGIFYK